VSVLADLLCELCVRVAVMVQLFNVPNLELIKKMDLLRLFVTVFGKILKRCLIRYGPKSQALRFLKGLI